MCSHQEAQDPTWMDMERNQVSPVAFLSEQQLVCFEKIMVMMNLDDLCWLTISKISLSLQTLKLPNLETVVIPQLIYPFKWKHLISVKHFIRTCSNQTLVIVIYL